MSENGVTKPYCSISLEEKEDIRKIICLNFVIMNCLAELQQFCSGLESLEVLEEIRKILMNLNLSFENERTFSWSVHYCVDCMHH